MRNRRRLLLAITPIALIVGVMLLLRFGLRSPDGEILTLPSGRSAPDMSKGFFGGKPPDLTTADSTTQAAIERTVTAQLTAIHKGDYKAALRASTPAFRAQMSPLVFRKMIENGYPLMIKSVKMEFRPAKTRADYALVEVELQDKEGQKMPFQYMMTRTEGIWFIQTANPVIPPRGGFPGAQPLRRGPDYQPRQPQQPANVREI